MDGWPSKRQKQSKQANWRAPEITTKVYIPHNGRDPLPQGDDTILMDASGRVHHEPGVYVFDPADPFDSNWPPEYSFDDRLNFRSCNAEASARALRHHAEYQEEVRQAEIRRAEIASLEAETDAFQDNPPPKNPLRSLYP